MFPLSTCNLAPVLLRVITQGQGLPTLHHLDWGFGAINHPVWSPDGHWIVALAGDDYAGAHVEVFSPDGKTRYYYVYNGHGNVVALVDASGNTIASYAHDAFGQLTSASESFGSGTTWTNPYIGYDGRA